MGSASPLNDPSPAGGARHAGTGAMPMALRLRLRLRLVAVVMVVAAAAAALCAAAPAPAYAQTLGEIPADGISVQRDGTRVTIDWQDADGATEYLVVLYVGSLIADAWYATSSIITDLELSPGAQYTIKATPYKGSERGVERELAVVAVDDAVSPSDTTAPVITLNGPAAVYVALGGPYAEQGATCTDETDPAPVLTTSGAVNVNLAGSYAVTYACTDMSGNSDTAVRTVTVAPGTTGPRPGIAELAGAIDSLARAIEGLVPRVEALEADVARLDAALKGRTEPPATGTGGGGGGEANSTDARGDTDVAKRAMLRLINEERRSAGLAPVALGDNAAAQRHAENMLDGCFASHWGLDGLKPYMRYALAGGVQYNAENVNGLGFCVGPGYVRVNLEVEVAEAMRGLMASPGHRDNILDPSHTAVSLGIAADEFNAVMVQHFEHGFVSHLEEPPVLSEDGLLSMSVALDGVHAAGISDPKGLSITVLYDPPPRNLTVGQVVRTFCYSAGEPVAILVRPPDPGYAWNSHGTYTSPGGCPDPYDVPPGSPPPSSPEEAVSLHGDAVRDSASIPPQRHDIPIVVSDTWDLSGGVFELGARTGSLTERPGVYTLVVFYQDGTGGHVTIMNHPIFHKMERPGGYD